MSETAKKGVLIVVVVLAVAAAAFQVYRMSAGDKMQVESTYTAPAGTKSEKQLAIEGQGGGAPPAPGKERDLGGPLGG